MNIYNLSNHRFNKYELQLALALYKLDLIPDRLKSKSRSIHNLEDKNNIKYLHQIISALGCTILYNNNMYAIYYHNRFSKESRQFAMVVILFKIVDNKLQIYNYLDNSKIIKRQLISDIMNNEDFWLIKTLDFDKGMLFMAKYFYKVRDLYEYDYKQLLVIKHLLYHNKNIKYSLTMDTKLQISEPYILIDVNMLKCNDIIYDNFNLMLESLIKMIS